MAYTRLLKEVMQAGVQWMYDQSIPLLVLFNSQAKTKHYDSRLELKDKIEILSVHCEGGTSFDEPLAAACELIRNDNNLKPADIVFITDGEASLNISDEINQTKKDTGTRICASELDRLSEP